MNDESTYVPALRQRIINGWIYGWAWLRNLYEAESRRAFRARLIV